MGNALGVGRRALSEEVPEGYKRTEVGVIPQDWQVSTIGAEFRVQLGKMLDAAKNAGVPKPYIGNRSVQWGQIDVCDIDTVPMTLADLQQFRLRPGDLLVCEGGEIGRAAIWDEPIPECYYQKALHRLRPTRHYDVYLMMSLLQLWASTGYLANYVTQTSIAHLPKDKFEIVPLPVPPPDEQRAIAGVLSDVDELLGSVEKLIAKKQAIKQAAMQQLLTGKTRLPGFSGAWERKKIAEVATYCNEKNNSDENLPVLTCSKHLGFVDSLSYFRNQVFSKDLSGYNVIRRGQIGYPANHIEEGSIGLQDIYDVALVSPIYVVFSPNEDINSYFLHRLLKLDRYRQEFSKATTASVDRRGSLRWPTFSELIVNLPYSDEQEAIAAVLSDMDAETAALERRRDKTRAIKQGMMQQLLTGRVRLVKPE